MFFLHIQYTKLKKLLIKDQFLNNHMICKSDTESIILWTASYKNRLHAPQYLLHQLCPAHQHAEKEGKHRSALLTNMQKRKAILTTWRTV